MKAPLSEKINNWILQDSPSGRILRTNKLVIQLEAHLYHEYEPTKGPFPSFRQRLSLWLGNVSSEEDQKFLFQLLPYIFFLGSRELESLYRTAFNCQIRRWLVEQTGVRFNSTDITQRIHEATESTWFCPITDSMRINAFYHLNHLSGRDLRPDWRALAELGDTSRIEDFIRRKGVKRIVLLEDFVCTGSQIEGAVLFAASIPSKIPVLVVPLIVCPSGLDFACKMETLHPHLKFAHVLALTEKDFLPRMPQAGEQVVFPEIRRIALNTYDQLKLGLNLEELAKLYGPFGFGDKGGLVVLHTNCPDNALPLIHQKSEAWHPLFPRASRL